MFPAMRSLNNAYMRHNLACKYTVLSCCMLTLFIFHIEGRSMQSYTNFITFFLIDQLSNVTCTRTGGLYRVAFFYCL